jgi:predicted ferric reductase
MMSGSTKIYFWKGVFWISLYLLFSFLPLIVVMVGFEPSVTNFWREFSIALGFVGLTMLCLQFIITARFRTVAAPFGLDMILQYHKYISLVAFGAILFHPILLFWVDPENLELLNVLKAPFRAQMAVTSTILLFIIIVISVYRKEFNIDYETWKTLHWMLAVLIIITAALHVFNVEYYLSANWKRMFWGFIIAISLFLLFYIRVLKPAMLIGRKYVVRKVVEHKGEAWSVQFEPVNHSGFLFMPGQFGWLTLGNSPFQIEEHPFSFSSSSEDINIIEMTIKALGDYTGNISKVKPGDVAHIEGPYGVFSPDRFPDSKGYIMLAGGVGITPMMSMIRTFADRKENRPLILIYANNTFEDIIFFNELEKIRKDLKITIVHTLAEPPQDWNGEEGFIDADLLKKYLPEGANDYTYFICGPGPMMDASHKALMDNGVKTGNIEMEVFDLV